MISSLSQASVPSSPSMLQLFPDVSLPLNSSDCMCEDITESTRALNASSFPLFNHHCTLNSECDGARCRLSLTVFPATYYLEVVVLSCVSPPAIEVLVENSALVPVGQWIFDRSGNVTIVVDGLPIRVTSVIKRGTRSIDVQVCACVL